MKYVFPACLLFLLQLSIMAADREMRFFLTDKANYGAGTLVQSKYYPGGVPNVGLVAGHANLLTRKDRIIMRFDISDLYLEDYLPKVKSAVLEFNLWVATGVDDKRKLKVDHLDYETGELSITDLSRPEVTTAAELPLKFKAHPPKGDDGAYKIDVTEFFRKDLNDKRQFTGFRLSDSVENANASGAALCYILQSPGVGQGKNPVLRITFEE